MIRPIGLGGLEAQPLGDFGSVPEVARDVVPNILPRVAIPTRVQTIDPGLGIALETGATMRSGVVVHHPALGRSMAEEYSERSLARIKKQLTRMGTLLIEALPSGLPRGAELVRGAETNEFGYHHVWTRDTVWIAHAWASAKETEKSKAALECLLTYYGSPAQRGRMIRGERPHIKFDGDRIEDMSDQWLKKRSSASFEAAHAQNDSLGLFLWATFRAAESGTLALDREGVKTLSLLVSYLDRIGFESDRECGVWEEEHRSGGRVLSSSLRAILAGLEALRDWADAAPERWAAVTALVSEELPDAPRLDRSRVLSLLDRGRAALRGNLPFESRGEGLKERRDDLALLVVLYLDLLAAPRDRILDEQGKGEILEGIEGLRRTHGHIRFPLDGYWGAYAGEVDLEDRKRLMRGRPDDRVERGLIPGSEAQWTLASPWLSAIYGILHRETGDPEYLRRQTLELNRALGMVTGPNSALGPGRLPESYALVPEPDPRAPGLRRWTMRENSLPLNWSKANLKLAIHSMEETLRGRTP